MTFGSLWAIRLQSFPILEQTFHCFLLAVSNQLLMKLTHIFGYKDFLEVFLLNFLLVSNSLSKQLF